MTRVSIHSLELTPLECEVLSELMAAKLEQHLADRAKYMRPPQASQQTEDNHAPESRLVAETGVSPSGWRPHQDSGASARQAGGNMVDAGQTTGPANPALLLQHRLYGKAPWPAKAPALVAWDLTLRCPVCNSTVEGNVTDYHCRSCWRTAK